MEPKNRVKLIKGAIRIGTFVTTSVLVMNAIDQVLPSNNMTKIGKIGMAISGAIIGEMVGYQASKFVDDLMDGTMMGNLIYGKDN